jgi:predicted site-specific integrase-resolvase
MRTISEMAKACGVSINTIGHWRQKGSIRARAINDRSQFLFEDPGRKPPKKHVRKIGRQVA